MLNRKDKGYATCNTPVKRKILINMGSLLHKKQ